MRLVVTRPAEDAAPLAERLRTSGHEVIVEPLLAIVFDTAAALPAGPWRAVVVTSANGITALARRGGAAELAAVPVLAVGTASAIAAREAGFATVLSADGALDALTALVRRTIEPGDGRLLYPTGRRISGDLAGILGAEGYTVVRTVLYDVTESPRLGERTVAALRGGALDGVLLFSRRTAEVWADLIDHHGLVDRIGRVKHYCLSQAVGEVIGDRLGNACPPVAVAAAPDTPSLLALLDR